MATEGNFPKADGDYLFASEANRFNPKVIGNHRQFTQFNASGPTGVYKLVGSVDYTASPAFSSHLIIEGSTQKDAASLISNTRIRISGTDLNMTTTVKATPNTTGQVNVPHREILTSGALTASGGAVTTKYVISLEANNNSDAERIFITDFMVWGF